MKALKITLACVLLLAMIMCGETLSVFAASLISKSSGESEFPSETNSFVEDFLIGETDQDAPFFEEILPAIEENIDKNNKHSVTPYYDKLPKANNPENFQGLGSTYYANINGKTVTAEAFYRKPDEGLHDPNCGMGLLLYQCIQYKLKHPDADMEIAFSSYRTSVTAAVCVIPESKYYGYMRSLYGTNYDEQGFVRISYMLVEAARMGIEVTMINQLPSYSVKQYNPETDTLEARSHINYVKYYNAAGNTACYDKYAQGKKVSDFLKCVEVGWTVEEQLENMQHFKTLLVSNYLATDGTEHTSGVYLTSSNFDENNYRGANGNNNTQSGVIISDHDDLYRVCFNYIRLMEKYAHQEGLQELRRYMTKANEEQIALINAGRGNEIPADEQIVYLGSETDKVFEMYFTPLGGSPDTWDTTHNPFAKYMTEFYKSDDYVEFVWIHKEYLRPYTGTVIESILADKYCNDPNPKNKIVTKIDEFLTSPITELEVGKEIGYLDIGKEEYTHSKDIMLSYEKEGARHYVSIMTSCNYVSMGFSFRTNSILIINETAETGNGFYRAFGSRYSYGMMDEYDDVIDPPALPSNDETSDDSQSSVSTEAVGDSTTPGTDASGKPIVNDGNSSDSSSGNDNGEDSENNSDGSLPTYAIVGIAAGSAVVLAAGTFSLIWFVIKKKTFADLLSVFKKKQ